MSVHSKSAISGVTLTQHISRQQRALRATGEFTAVLAQINLAGKIIARALSHAGLYSLQGEALGPQGENMGLFAKETFMKVFSLSPWVSTLVCEGGEPLAAAASAAGKYIVFVDPLDAASNLDVNGVTGSIFSVQRRLSAGEKATEKDLLQKGSEQVAAGYIMYGPSTMLVYTSGSGVNSYKLDTGIGEFLIYQENIRIPDRGLTYSCNEAHYHDWPEHTRKYIEHLRKRDARSDKYYSSRHARCLVFNLHRTLHEGGVCLYPVDTASDKPGGRRRLIYQCNPLAFITEQAGGRATNGTERILKIQPESLAQRSPLIVGSSYEVLLYEDFAKGSRA